MEVKERFAGVGSSFRHVGPRDQIQIVSFGGKHPYSLGHLTDPKPLSFYLGLSRKTALKY